MKAPKGYRWKKSHLYRYGILNPNAHKRKRRRVKKLW